MASVNEERSGLVTHKQVLNAEVLQLLKSEGPALHGLQGLGSQ